MAAPTIHRDPTEVLGRRFGAYLIDSVVGLVLLLAIGIPMLRGAAETTDHSSDAVASDVCRVINRETFDTEDPQGFGYESDTEVEITGEDPFCFPLGSTTYVFTGNDIVGLYLTLVLLSMGFAVVNMAILPGLAGGSIGKLAVGLRVVQADGSKAGIGRSILRWLLWIVDGTCLIGPIMVCVTKGHRRLGDMAAGTFVVGKDDMGQPVHVPGLTAAAVPYGAPADGPAWDASRNAYVQWDAAQNAWVQWDEASSTWTPIR